MSANISPSTPFSSPLTDKLPFRKFLKVLQNLKPFFIINNSYASNFTLQYFIYFWIISVICKKKFIRKNFLLKHLRSVLCHLFFSIFKIFLRWCFLVQSNGSMSLVNMSNMHENQWNKFVQSQHKKHKDNIKHVVLVSFLSTSGV